MHAFEAGRHKGGQQRRGDAVWRVRFRGRWLYLLILLEFQSRLDPRMALRILEYTALLYRELDRQDELGAPGRWPLEMRALIGPVSDALAPCQPVQRSLLLTSGGRRWTIRHSAT